MDASRLLMIDGRGLKVDPRGPTASQYPGGKTLGLPSHARVVKVIRTVLVWLLRLGHRRWQKH